MSDIGVTEFGGYIPRLRLQRAAVVEANAWANSALKAYAKGERSMCNWDEDSVTMAVEAARDCLSGQDRASVSAVHVASTSLPFSDRQNAGIVAGALNLGENIGTLDITSSRRAGTAGLINAINTVAAGASGPVLFIASEHRRSKTGSPQELLQGDGAAALCLGTDGVVARYLGGHSISVDFVDHYRGENDEFDYEWEERWIRDEGYLKIVPGAVRGLLEKTGVAAADIDHFVFPCVVRRAPQMLARSLGIAEEAIADTLHAECGDTGTAHAIVMFARTLEAAKPGEKILVAGFGQGCDALLFEVTDAIERRSPRKGISGALARRAEESNYDRFLTFNRLVSKDFGKRAETDRQTELSAFYRNRKLLTGFIGGRCTKCGTIQIPKSAFCVNPNCGELETQEDHAMADTPGKVTTWTADNLTFSIDPPSYFGMVQFDGGGRLMVDFTDVDKERLDIGSPVRMYFRVREYDEQRGFRKYFWKAVQSETGDPA